MRGINLAYRFNQRTTKQWILSTKRTKEKKMKKLLSLVFVCALCLAGAGQTLAGPCDTKPIVTLAGNITTDLTLDANNVYELDGKVVVTDGATLTIPAGTFIYGTPGTGTGAGWLLIDTAGNDVGGTFAPGAKIEANGTSTDPVIFSSEAACYDNTEAPGQWGGVTIVGNAGNPQVGCYEVDENYCPTSTNDADDSGTLNWVEINNSGKLVEVDKEINGLSLVGVGSGTTISNVTVNRSDDDCIECWGGTVNMSNCTTNICTDDQFDTDDGYSGTVTNLTIYQDGGNAAIERSGNTNETYIGLTIQQVNSAKEGVLYFKGSDGIGGSFSNVTICDQDYDAAYGVFHSDGSPLGSVAMDGITVYSQAPLAGTGPSGAALMNIFEACSTGGGCAAATCVDNPLPCQAPFPLF
jgi:hypothetical protein